MLCTPVHSNTGKPREESIPSLKSLEEQYTKQIDHTVQSGNWNELALLYNNRGHAKYMQVQFNSAVEDYSRAVELNPNLAVAYYNRGTIFYRMGSFRRAYHDMEKALHIEPLNAEFIEGYNECARLSSMQKP